MDIQGFQQVAKRLNVLSDSTELNARVQLNKTADGLEVKASKNFLGRLVSWFKDALGLNTGVNRQTARSFIEALASHYDQGLVRDAQQDLAEQLQHGKPLRVRQVARVLDNADAWNISDLDDSWSAGD